MATEHKFRYILPPGSDFRFVAKFRMVFTISALLMAASIAMLFVNKATRGSYLNWTIDFKGGTEIVYGFSDKSDPSKPVRPDPGAVRAALSAAGEEGFDVSDMTWTDKSGQEVNGMVVKTPRFAALSQAQADQAAAAFREKFADKQIDKVSWSGDRMYVRSKQSFAGIDVSSVFTAAGLEVKPWSEEDAEKYAHADEGTGEFNSTFAVWGIDRQLAKVLEQATGFVVKDHGSYGVGAKAGDQLRDDATKSIIFAMFLVMLYLAVRFDVRYAPGAAFATLHDVVMVVGVFAVTWTEVSLTTVAAVLTVIGYSVNDTVVIFDRIRENVVKHRDKKLDRIVDMSVNETLVRSILTSLTVFVTTLIMNVFGEGLVSNFAFAMNIGVITGSYSSIFLAAPIFLWISKTWYSGPARVRAGIPAAAAAQSATAGDV